MSGRGKVLLCAAVVREKRCCVLVTAEGGRAEWEAQLKEMIRLGQFMEAHPGEPAAVSRRGTRADDAIMAKNGAVSAVRELLKDGDVRERELRWMGEIGDVLFIELMVERV